MRQLSAIVLGVAFVYASLDKIWAPGDFARIVYHYRLIGPDQHLGPLPANLLAITLPWMEVLAGVLLIAGFWRREAAAVTGLMLVTFIFAVGWALALGIDMENCGCFSVTGAGRAVGWELLFGDVGLLALAVILMLPDSRAAQSGVRC